MQLLWCAICYLCDALHSVIISEHIGHLATAAIVSCAICRPCPWPYLPVQCSGHLLLARYLKASPRSSLSYDVSDRRKNTVSIDRCALSRATVVCAYTAMHLRHVQVDSMNLVVKIGRSTSLQKVKFF